MLSEQAIRIAAKNRLMILAPVMLFAVAGVLVYLAVLGPLAKSTIDAQFSEGVAQWMTIALILPAFAIFLLPSLAAERYCRRFHIDCPSCEADITRQTEEVLATRRCPLCEKRVVEGGRTRRRAVYRRYRDWKQIAFLEAWFWLWPALGLLCLVVWLVDPQLFDETPHVLFLAPLIGSIATGWAWARTRSRRYAASSLCSLLLLALSVAAFLRTF